MSEALLITIRAEAQKAVGEINRLKESAMSMQRTFESIGKNMSLFVTLPILAAGAASLKTAADFEKHQIAFETMLGSAEKSKILLDDVQKFAAQTPFELPGLITGAKRLLAFGIDAEKIVGTMRNLGNAAQGDQEILDRITLAFGKLKAKGKATLEELNMFTEAGVPILKALADQYGVTTERMLDMINKGKIGFEDVNKAITNLTTGNGQFAGMIEKQSQSLAGLWSTLMDDVRMLGKDLGTILIPAIKDAVKFVSGFVSGFKELDSTSKTIIMIMAGIAAAIGPAIKAITALRAAMVMLGAASGPVGVAVLAVTALVGATIAIKKSNDEWAAGQKGLIRVVEDSKKSIEDYRTELEKKWDTTIFDKNQVESIKSGLEVVSKRIAEQKKKIEEAGQAHINHGAMVFRSYKSTEEQLLVNNLNLEKEKRILEELETQYSVAKQKLDELMGVKKESANFAQQELSALRETERLENDAAKARRVNAKITEQISNQILAQVGIWEKQELAAREWANATLSGADKQILKINELKECFIAGGISQVDAAKWAEEEITKIQHEEIAKRIDKFNQYFSLYGNSASQVFGSISQIHKNYTDQELKNISDQYDAQREAIENTVTDEATKNKQLKDLDKKQAAAEREAKLKTFNVNKAFALGQAAISTALAISNGLATVPFLPLGLAMSITAGIAGGAQILAIASQVPSFALGGQFETKGDALFRAGENPGGRERITIEPLSSYGKNSSSNTIRQPFIMQLDGKEIYRGLLEATQDGIALIDRRALVG